ncbi:hypothetical protein BVC93_06740 [Mycobacterium sp. MS1601]|uniref:glycosyltransferase n=1 Tax=Mycobacterium sp. MS1601 TaxID=1936029 RepID=UPI00097910CA|nr:glycosyltransferase [Mycobacterium sp. MS1601]AQA02175.1 hypothetical protein BVC93_06740 [Mycobacterium sp. MS1601]
MTSLRHVEVVVPARDEEEHVQGCLSSIRAATHLLRSLHPTVSTGVTVVLDSCADSTAEIVRQLEIHSVAGEFGSVGAARRAGIADALIRADIHTDSLWLANTDADTLVPDTWLLTQLQLADNGADAVIGTVTPAGLEPEIHRLWREKHCLTEGHGHVHGANLGLRASVYAAAGGFADLTVHEDRDLVRRVRAVTPRWVATHRTTVTTSGRTHSRVDGGFASYVADLARDSTCV